MDINHLNYAVMKQLQSATALETNYGVLELDDELRRAVENALTPILEQRLGLKQDTSASNRIYHIQHGGQQCY